MVREEPATSPGISLVTGATGFIGGHLAARLLAAGRPVRLFVRDPAKLPADLRAGCAVVQGDLSDAAALAQAVSGAAVVYHCAANVKSWDSRDAYVAANVDGVRHLLEALARQERPPRLVHVSTVDVYGFPDAPCSEESSTADSGFGYGDSKRAGEQLVHEFCAARGIPYTVIRPANVIGPRSPFISRIGDSLSSGLMLTVGGGRAHGGFVYVGNLVDDMIWAADSAAATGQCYNVRDFYDVDWSGFLSSFRKAIGGRGVVIDLPFWAAEAVARGMEVFYGVLLPGREPLLHRLLVRIFGRTCGHSPLKIRAARGEQGRVGFDEALDISARWFLAERRKS